MKSQQVNFKKYLTYSLFLLSVAVGYAQFVIPPKPKADAQKAVYDYAEILSQQETYRLNEKLLRYADTTGTQIVVASIESLQGENIGILTPKWAHEWGIGQAQDDNGVFILLAQQERKIWIAPGYGAEVYLTAGRLGDLTRNHIVPYFKKGNYYQGLHQGTDQIMAVLSGKFQAPPKTEGGDFSIVVIFFVIAIFIIIIARKRSDGGTGGGTGSVADVITISRMGSNHFGSGRFGSRSGGGSSRGGGFDGGFGGGGFSGGGAGGSW